MYMYMCGCAIYVYIVHVQYTHSLGLQEGGGVAVNMKVFMLPVVHLEGGRGGKTTI